MALAPARLLVPARVVEPPLPSALSSASACSAAGAYSHFSFFFFHPPGLRSAFSISARVLEAQQHSSYRQNRHSQFRRQPGEAAPFDDLQTLYEEERGRSSYPNRNPIGRTQSTHRVGRGGSNGGRRVWEPSNYPSWRSRGVSGGEVKPRSGKPWSSQSRYESSWVSQREDEADDTYRGRSNHSSWRPHGVSEGEVKPRNGRPWSSQSTYESSWASQIEDEVDETYQGRSQQTMEDRRGRKFGSGSRDMDSKSSVRRGSAYDEGRNPPWQRRGSFYRQDAQMARQSTDRQGGEISKRPWEGRFKEERSRVAWRPQRQHSGGAEREQYGTQWNSRPGNSSSTRSITSRTQLSREFEEQATNHRAQIGSETHEPPPLAQRFYPLAPWQSSFSKEREVEGEEKDDIEEEDYEHGEPRSEFEEEHEQSNSSRTDDSPITRIMERLRNVDDRNPALPAGEGIVQSRSRSSGSLFLPSAREYLSDRSMPWPSPEESQKGELDTRFPWEIEEAEMQEDPTVMMARRLRPLSVAELTIPAPELKRLRILSVHLKQRVKLGKHGVTTDLVNSIMQRFRTCEVVKVKCEGPPAGNMKKTLETLEQKTGGMVIWKAGSVAVIYRGKDFGQPVSEIVDDILAKKLERLMSSDAQEVPSNVDLKKSTTEDGFLQEGNVDKPDDLGVSLDNANSEQATSSVSPDDASKQFLFPRTAKTSKPEFDMLEEYATEVEDILTDLGPRYEDWTGPKPVPVDADLLPAIIPNYSPPYRLLPYGVKPNISNIAATHLRRLSRPLAPHFVIGRDRGLQGLAAAMVKLWEKSEIAKIGVKRGVLNTNQERLAEELKQLTGGFFLCRDKNSMTFFRGKDFLPQAVSAALAERQAMAQSLQSEEERGRADRSIKVQQSIESSDVKPSWVHLMDPEEQLRLKKEAAKARRLQVVAHLERKLKMALRKKEKAGRELEKVEELVKPVGPSDDREILTDEERFMLKKLGLKMKAFLLVGRRGVFSGVVQNMHLHWKHRELVKIILKERDPVQLKETATMLERESGGILISVDPTSKGYAIVVYRGKNYARPPQLRPPNLLTKRLALKRSMEMQRRLSLSRHIQAIEEEIVHLRAGLSKLMGTDAGTEALESSKLQDFSEECADVSSSEKHDGPTGNQPIHNGSNVVNNSLSEMQQEARAISAEEGLDKQSLSEDDVGNVTTKISEQKLRRLCEMGPIYRAVRLSKTERQDFRNEVLHLSKAAQYLVGRSNPLSTVAKAIRLYFLDHAFIKIGVRNRPPGKSVQDIAEELEDLTGGTVYAQDVHKVILYRGWPSGENMPLDDLYNVLSPEQCDVLEDEDEEDWDSEDENSLMINADNAFETDEDEDVQDEESMEPLVSQWDRLSDGNTEEDEEEGDDDDDDDSQWDMSDGSAEDEEEGGDDDDDDDSQWDMSDGSAEDDDEKGDDGLMLDDTLDREMEKSFVEGKDEGADTEIKDDMTESNVQWDSFLVADDQEAILDLDLDEDV